MARGNFTKYNACWDHQDVDPTTAAWVKALRAGDIIQLIPRAHFICWVNFVQHASITVYYYESTRMKPLTPEPKSNAALQMSKPRDGHMLYKELERDIQEIRLLVLESGSFEDPVSCILKHISLHDSHQHVPYEALSYCWGNSSDRTTILVRHQPRDLEDPEVLVQEVTVTRNVHSALKHLRSRVRGTNRFLWIDAICVNQENLPERAFQVSIMSNIYSEASSVVIWLGEGDPSLQLAMNVIREVYKLQTRACENMMRCVCPGGTHLTLGEFGSEQAAMDRIYKLCAAEAQEHIRSRFGSLYELMAVLFGHPWFRRVWVLQEVLLSREAFLSCGYGNIPWKVLTRVNSSLSNLKEGYGGGHREPLVRMPSIWGRLSTSSKEISPYQGSPGILDIILQGLELNATDPRDKIFALLGFGDETRSIYKLPSGVRPDYEKPIREVFADFTRWWIARHKSLDILSKLHCMTGRTWQSLHCVQAQPHVIEYPTWAISHDGRREWAQATLNDGFGYNAAGGSAPDADLLEDSRLPLVLRLRGVRLAAIKTIGYFPFMEYNEQLPGLFEAYIKVFDPASTIATWTMPKVDVNSDEVVSIRHPRVLDHWKAHWMYGPRSKLPTVVVDTKLNSSQDDRTNAGFPCHDRCFFVTHDGLFGLCPAPAQEGDLIVILNGGMVPFLLREATANTIEQPNSTISGNILGPTISVQYEFIGECYVHGKMNGEVSREQTQNGRSTEIFEIV